MDSRTCIHSDGFCLQPLFATANSIRNGKLIPCLIITAGQQSLGTSHHIRKFNLQRTSRNRPAHWRGVVSSAMIAIIHFLRQLSHPDKFIDSDWKTNGILHGMTNHVGFLLSQSNPDVWPKVAKLKR